MARLADHSGWLVEHHGSPHTYWDLIAPNAAGDFVHLRRMVTALFAAPETWRYQGRIRSSAFRGPYWGASAIDTGIGTLELVAVNSHGELGHFTYSNESGWQGPAILPVAVAPLVAEEPVETDRGAFFGASIVPVERTFVVVV